MYCYLVEIYKYKLWWFVKFVKSELADKENAYGTSMNKIIYHASST